MKNLVIKYILYYLFILILFLPVIQNKTDYVEIKPLKGAIKLTERPKFKMERWFSGEFQNEFEKFVNDNIGFRTWFVRLRNQIAFSVFKLAKARSVIVGKDNYLYELNYLKAFNGEDFIGYKQIKAKVEKMKYLQDMLNRKNKTFIVCLAPGKGSFYPENFPRKYRKPFTDSTNYKVYSKLLKSNNVNHINFNQWFLEMKDTCGCLLYPKYGIHWSYYGILLATDSLINYVEKKRNINIPNIKFYNLKRSLDYKFSDYDIADGMNLIFKLKSEPMCYPQIKWITSDNDTKPVAIVISDSFYWSMFNIGVGSKSFSLGGFWYYNERIFTQSFNTPEYVEQVDIGEKMAASDIIILMSTEANLSKFSWDFVDQAIASLTSETIHSH